MRLIRYPPRIDCEQAAETDPSVWVVHEGKRRYVNGAPHVDSGFLTLLAQDGRRRPAGARPSRRMDGCPATRWRARGQFRQGARALERRAHQGDRTSGDRQRRGANVHPFLLRGARRRRDPAAADGSAGSFEPFLYGDYLWATTTQFVEFKGMEGLRRPLRRANPSERRRARPRSLNGSLSIP